MGLWSRIFSRRTQPPTRAGVLLPPPDLPQRAPMTIQTRQLGHEWPMHPGRPIAPDTIVNAFNQAEAGEPITQCDLFEDIIEGDGHLRSVIEARTLAVAGKPWKLLPGDTTPAAMRATEELEAALRETNTTDMIAAALGSRYYGFSGTEIDWRDVDGVIVPQWFIVVPYRRFRFDTLERPEITLERRSAREPLRPGRWVWLTNRTPAVTSMIVRTGLMRTATWYAGFKRWSWKDWVIYAQKFGIPLLEGIYDNDTTEEERERLNALVRAGLDVGGYTHHESVKVELKEPARAGDSKNLHGAIVAAANNEISKLVTGSTLTVDSGGPGSFALGKVHETRAFDLVVSDAQMVQDAFDRFIARPFVEWNGFPPGTPPPELRIHVAREVDPETRARILDILSGIGLTLDAGQIRDEFQLREPAPGDEVQPRSEPGDASPQSDG